MKQKKLMIAAVPLLIGGVIYLSLTKLSNAGKGHPSTAAASTTTPLAAAQPDKLHERLGLEQELKKSPKHTPILLRLSELARERGETKEAIRYLRELLASEPNHTEARLELGRALYESNDVQGALDETGKILEMDPKHTDALYNLGAIYGNLNKPDLARQYWEKAVAAEPDSDGARKSAGALQQLARK